MTTRAVVIAAAFAIACAAPAPIAIPPGLHEEAMAYDSSRDVFVLVGGIREDSTDPDGYSRIPDTYEWRPTGWTHRSASANDPTPRVLPGLAFDPRSRSLLMLGGVARARDGEPGTVKACPSCSLIRHLTDAWSYGADGWTNRRDAPPVTYPRLIFHPRRNTMLLLGNRRERLGQDGYHPVLVWREAGQSWTVIDSAGPRTSNSPVRATLDPRRDVVVLPVLEGPDAGVWEWNETWRRIPLDSGPAMRRRYTTVYDESRGGIVLFGGSDSTGRYFNDLWHWDGRRWTAIFADSARSPMPRSDGTLFYDARNRRLVHFGGLAFGDKLLREIWTFSGGTWSRIE